MWSSTFMIGITIGAVTLGLLIVWVAFALDRLETRVWKLEVGRGREISDNIARLVRARERDTNA